MDDMADFNSNDIHAAVAQASGIKLPEPLEITITGGSTDKPVNNPGNMRVPGSATKFQQFDTPEAGSAAIDKQLAIYQKRGINTLGNIISTWSPPNENKTADLIAHASKLTGIDPNAPLDVTGNPDHMQLVKNAILTQEGAKQQTGYQKPADDPMADFSSSSIDKEVRSLQTNVKDDFNPSITPDWPDNNPIAKNFGGSAVDPKENTLLKNLGKSFASLADNTIGGVLPFAAKQLTYAGDRALGASPTDAENASNKAAGYVSQPLGKAFGITNDPAYTNEASNKIMQAIGGAFQSASNKISSATGLPSNDVNNILGSLSVAVPGMVKKGATTAADYYKSSPTLQKFATGETAADIAGKNTNLSNANTQYAAAGSDAASIESRLSNASEQFKADTINQFHEAQQQYGQDWQSHINHEALNRQINADAIGESLTPGQATHEGKAISEEWNNRGTNGLGAKFEAQNKAQSAYLQSVRENAAPDVFTNSAPEHAETLIQKYKQLHENDKAPIDEQWKAIREQSNDGLIFDASKMMEDAQNALKSKKLTSYDPGGQLLELLGDVKRGGLSADGYVAWRQNLGREAMKGGNEGNAASAIIDATNKSDLLPQAEQYRSMVQNALKSGSDLHKKIAADPAYKAVVNDTASVKNFVNNYIVNGKPENLANMVKNLAHDDVSQQTIKASLLDTLRDKASLNDKYEGNFVAKSFNNANKLLTPNAKIVFKDGELQKLQSLGDYSSDVSHEGRDSYKNYSNTSTDLKTPSSAMLEKAGGMAQTGLEGYLAYHTGGASVPIVGALKEGMKAKNAIKSNLLEQEKAAKYLHSSTRPSAGLIK
jgi:hypothetical protein